MAKLEKINMPPPEDIPEYISPQKTPRHSERYRKFCRENATTEQYCSLRDFIIKNKTITILNNEIKKTEIGTLPQKCIDCAARKSYLCAQSVLCHARHANNAGMGGKPDDFDHAYIAGAEANTEPARIAISDIGIETDLIVDSHIFVNQMTDKFFMEFMR